MTTDASFREAVVQFQGRQFAATRMTGASAPIQGPIEPAISVLAEIATNTPPLPAHPVTPQAIRVQPQRAHRTTVGSDFVTPSPRQPRSVAATPQHVSQSVTVPGPSEGGPHLSRVAGASSLAIEAFETKEEAANALPAQGRRQYGASFCNQGRGVQRGDGSLWAGKLLALFSL